MRHMVMAITAVLSLLGTVVLLVSPEQVRITYTILLTTIGGICLWASRQYWASDQKNGHTVTYWLRLFGRTLLVLGAMLLADVVLGMVFYPDLPIHEAAYRNVGFMVTVLVSPAALIPLAGAVRASLQKLIRK